MFVPLYVSQKNSESAFGLDADRFLEAIRASGVPVIRRGHLRLVKAELLAAYLDGLASAPPTPEREADAVAKVLARANLRAT